MKSVSVLNLDLWIPLTTGAHQDMNLFTFIDSTISLRPYFQQYLHAGLTHKRNPLGSCLISLEKSGVAAEKAMLRATHAINTHKGANFSFAVILGATGWYFARKGIAFNKRR